MNSELIRLVWERADSRCEYCWSPSSVRLPNQIDHIIAQQHLGQSTPENLCLACFFCNSRKGPNIAGMDWERNEIVPLYHPRLDVWNEHFEWQGAEIVAKSPKARATILALGINEPDRILLRELLIAEGALKTD